MNELNTVATQNICSLLQFEICLTVWWNMCTCSYYQFNISVNKNEIQVNAVLTSHQIPYEFHLPWRHGV